jgi:hypothetical protein
MHPQTQEAKPRRSAASEYALRRSDIQFLRQSVAHQTRAAPFDPCCEAPHSGLPLWKFAHLVAWQSHEKRGQVAAARRRAAAAESSGASSDAGSLSS